MTKLDTKVEALLLKIRKGATASINENALAKKVFPAIGGEWKVEKFGSLAKYRADGAPFGFTITAPNGKSETFHHGRCDYKTEKSAYQVFPWLKSETDFEARVLATLGMEAHVSGPKRDLTNTGTCAVCFGNFKLKARGTNLTIVHHGYTQPWNRGQHVGECFGAGYRAYERSAEGTERYIARAIVPALQRAYDRRKDLITANAEQRVVTFQGRMNKVERIPTALDIANAEQEAKSVESTLKAYEAKVAAWKLTALPDGREVG